MQPAKKYMQQVNMIEDCSVVTKDVPAWTIVAGNPAKIIREIPANER